MTDFHQTHLTYDDLLRAMVDRDDLDDAVRQHYDECPSCQNQARKLAERYTRMGRMAKALSPAPPQAFRVPEPRSANARWQFRAAMAFGMAGVLVFALTVWWPKQFDTVGTPNQQMAAQTIEEDKQLMAQIDALVDNALPDGYRELAMMTVTDVPELSEDLIDWIVPSIEGTMDDDGPVG